MTSYDKGTCHQDLIGVEFFDFPTTISTSKLPEKGQIFRPVSRGEDKQKPPKLLRCNGFGGFNFGSGRRIRTLTNRVRVCRATLTQSRYFVSCSRLFCFALS